MTSPIAERLLSAPANEHLRDSLAGSPGWIVGGALRDALTDREVVDLDLAIDGNPAEVARRLAAAANGFAFELSHQFGTWRAVAGDRTWQVDVTRLRGDGIDADLAARDFTANALAVPVDDPAAPPLDPFGGAPDIEARTLRAVGPRSFEDDPLRLLRAARLAAELGFAIERETMQLARASAGRAAEPAGERQLAELRQLISGPDPLRGLQLLDELRVTGEVLPELAALQGVEQNPNHHLDVHGHTIEVLRHLLEIELDLERYAAAAAPDVADLLAEPLADEFTRSAALRFGAIVHDIGKPATRQEHDRGLVSFIGHDRVGAELVGGVGARLKASRALTGYLQQVTLHHLHLGFMAAQRPLERRRLYDYLRLTEPVAADVTLLTVADRLAARGTGPTASPQMIEAHLELAREVLPEAVAWHRDGPPRAPIAGDELAAAVGIQPGPELGRLLAEIQAAVFTGEVHTAEQAIDYANRLRRA